MSDACGECGVVVHIGHVIIPGPCAGAAAESAVAVEPALKMARAESVAELNSDTSMPADVVTVAAWSEEGIVKALRRYAVAALEVISRGAVESSGASPPPAAVAAVLKAVKDWGSSHANGWPAVRLSFIPAGEVKGDGEAVRFTAAGWSALRFSFVPAALDLSDSASAAGGGCVGVCGAMTRGAAAAVDDTTMLCVLAAIPLPRRLCVPCQGASIRAAAGTRAGCVSAVFTERVQLHAASTTPPAAWFPGQHSPASKSMLAPCIHCGLPAELRARPLFLVGAGGIGCEVLKVLLLSGFTDIHIIDLDTIDATNLNRQFLFQPGDVGHSKAETARRVVLEWFASADSPAAGCDSADFHRNRVLPSVIAHHDNVSADRYDDAFYQQFFAVLSALDNVSARQHVNRMCMRNNIPLIESGTMGYNGQVQPILKNVYECYDCRPKQRGAKTYAVCTIHARPTTMVHCVHYAKELYEALFGGDPSVAEDAEVNGFVASSTTAEADLAPNAHTAELKGQSGAAAPGDGGELSYLRTVVSDWRHRLTASSSGDKGVQSGSLTETSSTPGLSDGGGDEGTRASSAAALAVHLLQLLFVTQIEELLSMKSSWPTAPPVPLSRGDMDCIETSSGVSTVPAAPPAPFAGDRVLTVQECVKLFLRAVTECLARPSGVVFQKEDDSAVRFVSAVANLRAHVFHITEQPLEEIRSIAGSIVPAISTTNAMIAGAVVHELIALLRSSFFQVNNTATAQATLFSAAKEAGRSPPTLPLPSSASSRSAPLAHVVYARKAPQSRRRRVPLPSPGQRTCAPSLFMEYTDDVHDDWSGSILSSNDSLIGGVRRGSLRAALRFVGAEHTSEDLLRFYSAEGEGGCPGRGVVVTDQYLVHSTLPNPPNRLCCLVCQDVYPEVSVSLNLCTATLRAFVNVVLKDALKMEAPSVSYGTTMLYEDGDYEALAACTLADVLQLPPDNREQILHQRQAYTLTVDCLNKNVAWGVVLMHDGQTASSSATPPSTPGAFFTVSGLEQAESSERRALARLAAHDHEKGSLGEEEVEGSRGVPRAETTTDLSTSTTIPLVVTHVVSDDDDHDDAVMSPATDEALGVVVEREVIELD